MRKTFGCFSMSGPQMKGETIGIIAEEKAKIDEMTLVSPMYSSANER